MKFHFSKHYRYVTNHLLLYFTNYCIFLHTMTLLLPTIYLTLVNVKISYKYNIFTYCHIVQISRSNRSVFIITFCSCTIGGVVFCFSPQNICLSVIYLILVFCSRKFVLFLKNDFGWQSIMTDLQLAFLEMAK